MIDSVRATGASKFQERILCATRRAIRARTGVAMSTTEKIAGRAAWAALVVSGYLALRAVQNEYAACMNYWGLG